MEATAHYRQLLQLGREEFLAAAAPAALVHFHRADDLGDADGFSLSGHTVDAGSETLPHSKVAAGGELPFAVYPLVKKPGASFPDRITIGRTPNNDLVIADASISRLHAYVKQAGAGWVVADAGSKNGSWLDDRPLEARKERPLPSRGHLRLGDVDLTFFLAADLYAALGGT